MLVYKDEIKDGMEDLVKANTSLAYVVPAKPLNIIDERVKDRIHRSLAAANKDQPDLFYLDTILVTTCWNKNADIFAKEPTWAARHTAEDKPFNLGHNQKHIIGHITDNFTINDKYELIPNNASLDNVPEKFHIVTGAVIYKFWEDKEEMKAVAKIIEEIQEGDKWYVSMECLFSDFDYGLLSAKGEMSVISRNDDSSFLTKHLRQYGGKGKYQDYSIGRVLKNITFSGKGLVENPANPESKILTDVKSFKSVSLSLGYVTSTVNSTENTSGENEMSLEIENTKLQATVADLQKQLSETGTKALQEKVVELTSKLDAAEKEKEKVKKDMEAKATELADAKKKADNAEEEAKEAKKDAKAANDELAKVVAEKTKADRAAQAVKAGATDEDAKALVEKYAGLPDEAFADMITFASYKWKAVEAPAKTETPAATAAKVLETAEKPAVETTVASTPESEPELVVAQIHAYMKNELNKKKETK